EVLRFPAQGWAKVEIGEALAVLVRGGRFAAAAAVDASSGARSRASAARSSASRPSSNDSTRAPCPSVHARSKRLHTWSTARATSGGSSTGVPLEGSLIDSFPFPDGADQLQLAFDGARRVAGLGGDLLGRVTGRA